MLVQLTAWSKVNHGEDGQKAPMRFTWSCPASAYAKAVIHILHTGKVVSRDAGIIRVGFTAPKKNATTWGKYGRHHIGEAIRTSKVNMDDDAVSWIMMTMAPKT